MAKEMGLKETEKSLREELKEIRKTMAKIADYKKENNMERLYEVHYYLDDEYEKLHSTEVFAENLYAAFEIIKNRYWYNDDLLIVEVKEK